MPDIFLTASLPYVQYILYHTLGSCVLLSECNTHQQSMLELKSLGAVRDGVWMCELCNQPRGGRSDLISPGKQYVSTWYQQDT
jgi:hypothetical protein